MYRAAILIAALTGALIAVPASADVRYAGQRTNTDATMLAMRDAAARYWDNHGVTGCIPAFDVADTLAGTDNPSAVGRAWGHETGECRIAVESSHAGMLLARAHRPWHGWRYGARLRLRRGALADLCALVVHETGHARGLEHTIGGVMDRRPVVPVACRVLSRRLIPRR